MERLAKRALLVDSERVRRTGDAERRSVSNHARLRVAGSKTATGCLRDSSLCREGQYGRSSRLPPAGNAHDRLSCLRTGFCPVGILSCKIGRDCPGLTLTLVGGYVRKSTTYSCLFCESGGTGRRARLRISWATVGVQIPPLAP